MEINFYKDFRAWAKKCDALKKNNAGIGWIEQYNRGFITMPEALRLLIDEQTFAYINETKK